MTVEAPPLEHSPLGEVVLWLGVAAPSACAVVPFASLLREILPRR